MRRTTVFAALALGATTVGLGCADGENARLDFADVQGIYAVTAHLSSDRCDAPGSSIADIRRRMLVAVARERPFQELIVRGCDDLVQCHGLVETLRDYASNIYTDDFTFTRIADDTLQQAATSAGTAADGTTCLSYRSERTLRQNADDSITIQELQTFGEHYPADGNGQCSLDDADRAVEGQPCGMRIDVAADLVETLE